VRIFGLKTDTTLKVFQLGRRRISDGCKEPGFGEPPGALDRTLGYLEEARDLGVAQPNKKPQLHHVSLERIDHGEFIKDFVDLQQSLPVIRQRNGRPVEFHTPLSASVTNLVFAPGGVDQDGLMASAAAAKKWPRPFHCWSGEPTSRNQAS